MQYTIEKLPKTMGITNEGQVTVLIHCGSRGFGHEYAAITCVYLRLHYEGMI